MKYIMIEGDGMADYPMPELGGKTPLLVADTQNMDFIASHGRNGMIRTIPQGMPAGSDVANLSIFGYDPEKYFSGRGPLEAAAMGIELGSDDIALRCNLVYESEGILQDYSAGHISTKEAEELIKGINDKLGKEGEIEFYPGVGYRHLLVLRNHGYSDQIKCFPPHDHMGSEFSKIMVRAKDDSAKETADVLNKLITDSRDILSTNPVNRKRKVPGNMIWFWGSGKTPDMPTLEERFGITGAVITAVDLIKGIGVYAGMKVINVPGATGYIDTNYKAKADYALKALEEVDLVFIHVESPDEMGHEGNLQNKIRAIEDLDKKVIGRIMEKMKGDYVISVFSDHPTPITVKTHVPDPVPFAIYRKGIEPDGVQTFDEKSAKKGSYNTLPGSKFIEEVIEAGR
jgi:2,3-bisphosphoglycerate-independent phosphoglycerate mutase